MVDVQKVMEILKKWSSEEKYELSSLNYSLFCLFVELFGRSRMFLFPYTSFRFLFLLSFLQVIFCLLPLHASSRHFTPLHAAARCCTLLHAASRCCTPLHAAARLFTPLYASSRFTPLHDARIHGPLAIDISSSANYADVLTNASSVVSVRSFFSAQGDR